MTSKRPAVMNDELFGLHEPPDAFHPERPERLIAAREGLRAGLGSVATAQIAARDATSEELERVHAPEHVALLRRRLATGRGQLDGDTFFSPGTRDAAWCAAGGTIDLCRSLWNGDSQLGFALVRPPGHHAERERAMGFCLLNNIAIAAADLLAQGARRVAIVDWDVHHGNGTQQAFYSDPRVLVVSLHQADFYPGTGHVNETGEREGRGFNCNIPLPARSGPEVYGEAFRRLVTPLLVAFEPEMILVSAGFDAHRRDPLASMLLDANTYRAMATELIRCASIAGRGRVAWILEGGYDLEALNESVRGVAEAAVGRGCELPAGATSREQSAALERAHRELSQFWPRLR